MLEGKALTLVGGPTSQPLVPGKGQVQGVFLANKADLMLGYCSGSAAILRDVPGLVSLPLPPELTEAPAYGLVVLSDQPAADRFAVFVMSRRFWQRTALRRSLWRREAADPARGVAARGAGRPAVGRRHGLPGWGH